jgi:uncharacterized protein YfbU (UPF0304 family)
MVTKTERFEMRLDEEIISRVDSWRAQQTDVPSRAEAMRRLVETGLAERRGDAVRFSDGEKLLLLMMRDLFKHLKMKDAESDVDFISKVIFGGHYWAPKWKQVGVFHDHEDNPAHLRVVLDVLEMWDSIERGYERLSKKDRERVAKDAEPFGERVRFWGFDGNTEAAYSNIARFLVNDMDRYTRFKGRDLNSHMPTLGAYGRMLEVFAPIRSALVGGDLSAGEIIALLKALPYKDKK